MKLRLSYRLCMYIGGILIAGSALYMLHDYRSDLHFIYEIASSEGERVSTTLFGQLHTSMRLGGGRAENRAIIKRFNNVESVSEVRVIHGPSIDRQFGPEEDESPRDSLERAALTGRYIERMGKDPEGYRTALFVRPVVATADCKDCHLARTGEVLGAISVRLSLKRYETVMEEHAAYMYALGGGILACTIASVLLIMHRRLISPVNSLKVAAGELAAGNLEHRVGITTGDEFQELGESFDDMADSLLDVNKRLTGLNEKHSMLVRMAADAIVLIDLETQRVVDANPAAVMLSGYSAEELKGMPSDELFPPERLQELKVVFQRWVYDGRGYLHDAVVRNKDGFCVPVDIAASVLAIEGRQYIQEIWRDTSERKGFEERLKQNILELEDTVQERTRELNLSLSELEEAYRKLKDSEGRLIQSAKLISLGEMGAGIAHELNSPIAGILSISEVLLGRANKNDPNYFLLEKIKDAAVRSKYIILDMLTYSRPRRGELTPVFVNETIRATLTIYVSELKASNIEVIEDFDPELPRVNANQGQLMEVILNIIKNARDAAGDRGRVHISTRTLDVDGRPMVVAEIRDSGPGIPPEIIDRIFDPFFSTKEKGGGLNIGLGLAISQSIMKEHGGRIEVRNAAAGQGGTELGGAVFRVLLPVADQQ